MLALARAFYVSFAVSWNEERREQALALPNGFQMEYLEGMKRPSKKEIREAVQKLKEPKEGSKEIEQASSKPQEKSLNSQRIRKKGV